MRKLLLLSAFLFCYGFTFAQSTNISTLFYSNVKKGDQFFDHLAYRNALEIYLHAHEKDPGNYYLRERIGTCYFKLHDPATAEIWFGALAKETDIHPEIKFEYAEALSMTGNYGESKIWFEKYLKDKPNDKIAQDKLSFLKSLKKYTEDSNRFIISTVDFNSDHSDYGAHFFHDGVVFASSRDLDLFLKHKPFDALDQQESLLNLYYAARKPTGEWEPFVPFHTEHLKTYFHEGPMAFYDNYKKGAFTQSNLKDGKPVYDATGRVNLRIFFADVVHLGEFVHVAPFEYNNDGYSTAHPSFTPDGKTMYFSSTNPTGFGDSDIYYSTFENGRWTEPVNVGAHVNTFEDESFPYISNDTTLYFSSNGHGTLGGLDLYVSYKRKGVFGKPTNLGAPMNTMYDDFSLVADSTGRVGFIASNRPDGKGIDDIYFYIANYYFLAGEVRDIANREKIPNATVYAFNGNGELMDSTKSDGDGYFNLNLPFDQDYKIRGEKEGYESLSDVTFSTRGKPFGVDSLLLPMWKQSLFVKGKVTSRQTNAILSGTTVTLNDITTDKLDTVALNDQGEYTFLLRPDRNYRIEASKEGHETKAFEFDTKGLKAGEIRKDIVLDELNADWRNLYFAFDKADITKESKVKMDFIIRTLTDRSDATLTLDGHADSRGKTDYNLRLSQRRAEAAKQYFISKGIVPSRISTQGFGETLPVNKCADGVKCAEEEHARNRRAEMKINYKAPEK